MAAEVESMFYVRKAPWHGLGTKVEDAPTSEDALELAGLNWDVIQEKIYTGNGNVVSDSTPISAVPTIKFWVLFLGVTRLCRTGMRLHSRTNFSGKACSMKRRDL